MTPDTQHDIALLGLNGEYIAEDVKKAFQGSDIYQWLRWVVSEPLPFGKISEIIHSSVIDVENLRRKNVKELQAILYKWVEKYASEEFAIYVPPGRHSQIIAPKISTKCRVCGKSLSTSRWKVLPYITYKSCPKCSTKNGLEHVFYSYPDSFGETAKRSNRSQSYCRWCRSRSEPEPGIPCSKVDKYE